MWSANPLLFVLPLALGISVSGTALGEEPITAEEWNAKLGWKTGEIQVARAAATLHFADDFRYLGPLDARKVLIEAWGNPAESAENVLGMVFANGMNPAAKDSWGVVVTFEEDGHVSDEGVDQMDYAAMLKEMQESVQQGNQARQKLGFQAVDLVGWAEPPHYDRSAHKLYWAKELRFQGSEENTLNYNIRVLGRRGVLVLNAVSGMHDLERVKSEVERLLPRVDFNEGHRFSDYVPGQDKVAEYGIAALIAGGAVAAAKFGLFKWLIGGLIAFKKLFIVGAIGVAGAFRRIFGRKPEHPPNTES